MNPGPAKKYCKAFEKSVKCEECEKRFHTSCMNIGEKELLEIESGNGSLYVLFYIVTKQSNVTNVKCGFTIMNALSSQNLNLN